MQVIEITLGGERKRPGAQQFSSDTVSASVTLAIHPGDRVEDAIAEARRVLEEALGGPAEPRAAPAPKWHLHVTGLRPADNRPRSLGLRWVNGEHFGEYAHESEARRVEGAVKLFGDVETRLEPPAGGKS